MAARNLSLAFASNGQTLRVQSRGTCVTCNAGAWVGMRIHFEAPSSAGYPGEFSLPLVNGESYFGPRGAFDEFWLTNETIATRPMRVELTVLDGARPSFDVMRGVLGGWRTRLVSSGALTMPPELPPGATIYTLYADAAAEEAPSDAWAYSPRSFLGGCLRASGPFQVHVRQYLNPDGTVTSFLGRTEAGTPALPGGLGPNVYYCSLDFGLHDTGNTTRRGALLVPWPHYGLKVLARAGWSGVVNLDWSIYERTPLGACARWPDW